MRLLELIDARGIAILDGGLATELERRGHDLDDPLWSARVLLETPDAIVDVHRDYLEAGADIVTTASYQATFAGLECRGLDRDAAANVIATSVRLARRACEDAGRPDALVAGAPATPAL